VRERAVRCLVLIAGAALLAALPAAARSTTTPAAAPDACLRAALGERAYAEILVQRSRPPAAAGFVYDFGANEEWTAVRGGGAFLNGKPLTDGPKDFIEFLSIEATRAALVHDRLRTLAPLTDRLRVAGAQAITYCHLAGSRRRAPLRCRG